jgi:hypothetical protein
MWVYVNVCVCVNSVATSNKYGTFLTVHGPAKGNLCHPYVSLIIRDQSKMHLESLNYLGMVV